MFIPTCFVSYKGKALDERPLHRRAVHVQAGREAFKHLGFEVTGMVNNIGLEQELFFIPRKRMSAAWTFSSGRTVLGKMPARGQEGCDHYMAPRVAGPPWGA